MEEIGWRIFSQKNQKLTLSLSLENPFRDGRVAVEAGRELHHHGASKRVGPDQVLRRGRFHWRHSGADRGRTARDICSERREKQKEAEGRNETDANFSEFWKKTERLAEPESAPDVSDLSVN